MHSAGSTLMRVYIYSSFMVGKQLYINSLLGRLCERAHTDGISGLAHVFIRINTAIAKKKKND